MSNRFTFLSAEGRLSKGSPAFALVSTLLIIAVLTIMVVAFMQSMRIDRLTAKSYLDKYKADLAARSAVNQATFQIQSALIADTNTGRMDLSYTTELLNDPNTNSSYAPVTVITRYVTNGTNISRSVTALVSSSNNYVTYIAAPSNAVSPSNSLFGAFSTNLFAEKRNLTNSTDLNSEGEIQLTNTISTGSDTANFFRVSYLPLTNSVGLVSERYAYAVFDEQARINPKFHRSTARDNYATNAEEVPVSVGTSTNGLLTTVEEAAFLAANSVPSSPESMGPFFSTTTRAHEKKQFFGYYDVVNQDVIPGTYPDGGKPKYNIKDLATNVTYGTDDAARALNIANIIDRNIPTFKDRDPSFAAAGNTNNSIKYVRRVAANIVDYIDSTAVATTANNGEPAGKSLFPMVTGIAQNFKWMSKGSTPTWACTFQTQYYVQLWNPYTYPVTGKVRLLVQGRMPLRVGNAVARNLKDYDQSLPDSITVQPNEMKVVELAAASENTYNALVDPDSPITGRPLWDQTSSSDITKPGHPYFQLFWNGKLVDMNRHTPW